MFWFLTSFSLVTIGLYACQGGNSTDQFEISSYREGTTINASISDDTAVFDIYSESGMGHGEVELVSGEWPAKTLLRFHLAGLEMMHFAYEDTSISFSVTRSGPIIQEAAVGENNKLLVEPDSEYWMPVEIVSDKLIEVQAPADFSQSTPTGFIIDWVDFYR